MKRPGQIATLFAFCLFFMLGCKKDEPTAPTGDTSTFEAVIASGGVYPAVQVRQDSTTRDSSYSLPDGSAWICKKTTYDVTKAPAEYPMFLDFTSAVIYPGALLKGASLEQNPPTPIAVNRAGGSVFITLLNGSRLADTTVSEVKGSTIYTAINRLIAANTQIVPANFTYTVQEVKSREQLAIAMNVNVSTLDGSSSVNASMRFSTDRSYNRFLVTLQQVFYTVAYDLPTSFSSVFAPDVTPQQLANYVGPGNPATYVAAVNYGRRFYMLIESTSSKQTIEASIEATYSGAVVVNGTISGTYVTSLSNRNIKAYAQGGDANAALAAVNGGFTQLQNYLTQGGQMTTGVPLAYLIRNLRDNTAVKVKVASKFDVVDCIPIALPTADRLFWYRADTLVSPSTGRVTRVGNAFNDNTNPAVDWGLSPGPTITTLSSMNNKPLFYFRPEAWAIPAGQFHYTRVRDADALRFDGSRLVNSPYTIFMVVRNTKGWVIVGGNRRPSPALPGNPPPQSGDVDGVFIGRRTTSSWSRSHYSSGTLVQNCQAPDQNPSQEGKLFTMIFSPTEGSIVYINGVEVNRCPNSTIPAGSFRLSRLQVEFNGDWVQGDEDRIAYIGEVMAVGKALDDGARTVIEEQMMKKYRIAGRQ